MSISKLHSGNNSQKTRKSIYQTFLVLSSFTRILYFAANILSRVEVADFQPADTVKNYFTVPFQAFYTRTRSSHSKAFIY